MNSYFSHDSNARNDEKLIRLRMKHGAEGYGVYFMILERLRDEADYMSVKDYNVIAFDLRVDANLIKDIVENFGLFAFTDDGKCFYSESFNKRMSLKDEAKQKRAQAGKKGAKKRWNNKSDDDNSNENNSVIAKPLENDSNAMAMPSQNNGKESKVNKSKVNKKKSKSKTPAYADDDRNLLLSADLFRRIKTNNPETRQPDLQKWANDIRLMHERDGRSYEKIARMIERCQTDDFWQANILSAKKLREKYDTMAAQFNRPVQQGKAKKQSGVIPDWLKEQKESQQSGQAVTAHSNRISADEAEELRQSIAEKLANSNS